MTRQANSHLYGGHIQTANRRVGYMVDAGLLFRGDNLRWAGSVLWPSAAGMRACGLGEGAVVLPPPEMPTEERLLHRLLTVDWAMRAGRQFDQVVSEREMRTVERQPAGVAEAFAGSLGLRCRPSIEATSGAEQARQRWFAIPVRGGPELHWPDVLAVWRGGLVAVEIEVSVKPADRVRRVLNAYRAALDTGHVQQVAWMVTPQVWAQLGGWQTPSGTWVDGLLQQMGFPFAPAGGPVDWQQPGLPMVLRQVQVDDDGLRYAMDQKSLPTGARCSFRQWKMWQDQFQQLGEPDGFTFPEWLLQPRVLPMLHAMS